MMSAKDMQERSSSRDLLDMLNRVYAGRGIQRDVFGRRRALPSEVSRVLEMNTTPAAWQAAGDAAPAPISPFASAEE